MGHWPSGAPGAGRCTTRTTSRVATITDVPSLFTAAHEHLDQGANGASPMRDALLGRERRFGEGGEAAALGEIARLGHGVLGEARATLQVLLLREPLQELVRRKDELKRQRGEDITDLPGFPIVARRDQELHRLASRRSRARS